MAEYQPWTDRQTVYVLLLLAALVLLWDLLPSTRPWITPSTLALVCVPLWLYVLHAEPHSSARRAYHTLARRASLVTVAAALLLHLQGAR